MKKMLFGIVMAMSMVMSVGEAFAAPAGCHNDVRVSGFYRNNGVYVNPYYRTRANDTQRDNWSSRPNRNPHTGAWGTRTPRW